MITDTCKCGATFSTSQPYACEEASYHAQWLDAHAVCREWMSVADAAAFLADDPAVTDRVEDRIKLNEIEFCGISPCGEKE